MAALLLKGVKIPNHNNGKVKFSVGIISGLFNGAAAIGGLPIVLFLIAITAEAAILRATMTSYFLFSEFIAIGAFYFTDQLTIQIFWRVALFALPMLIGVQLGSRYFHNQNPENFKRLVLSLLSILAISGLLKILLFNS